MVPNDDSMEDVARLFALLAEPSRLRILRYLQGGPSAVSGIIQGTGLKQANVSKQLQALYQAGVLDRRKNGVQVEYAVALPLIYDLCELVCNGLRTVALRRAETWLGEA